MKRNKTEVLTEDLITKSPKFEMNVTWLDPNEYLPITTCSVVVVTNYGHITTAPYSRKYKKFNCLDVSSPEDAAKNHTNKDIKYWSYIHNFPI